MYNMLHKVLASTFQKQNKIKYMTNDLFQECKRVHYQEIYQEIYYFYILIKEEYIIISTHD